MKTPEKNLQTKERAFADIAEEVFAPIYPVIADNIVQRTKITHGKCLDIGSGPGHLGLAIADICTDMEVILLDQSDEMIRIAAQHCRKKCLSERVVTRKGDAVDLPFPDNSINLVVSRGSIFFWKNQVQAVNEIYRILKPEGHAYIGGGFGNKRLFLKIKETMDERLPDWNHNRTARMIHQNHHHFASVMDSSQIPDFSISGNDHEMWIHFHKKIKKNCSI